MAIQTRRVYEKPDVSDGLRILVDRLWPRGLSREKACIDFWARSIAPSDELRRWYGHDPVKWEEFQVRYFQELDAHQEEVEELREKIAGRDVTFLYSSKEEELNNAVALKDYLERD